MAEQSKCCNKPDVCHHGPGSGYYRRESWGGAWEYTKWGDNPPATRREAVELLKRWANTYDNNYAMLRCSGCGRYHGPNDHGPNEWLGEYCEECEEKRATKKLKLTPGSVVAVNVIAKSKPTLVRKEGDIWKLPSGSSPMWTEQWGYQGSSKTPYVISHRTENTNGSMTEEGWACSCPNFTRHTPRTDCKHILNVKLKEGLGGSKAKAKLANVADKTLAEFEQWQREKAARKAGPPTAGDAKLHLFGSTGRKFR